MSASTAPLRLVGAGDAGGDAAPAVQREGGKWWRRQAWLIEVVRSGRFASLSPAGRSVLVVLHTYANGDRVAWPSTETVARNAGVSASSVKRARRELERAGLLATRRGGGRDRTEYVLADASSWGSTDAPQDGGKAPGRGSPGAESGGGLGGELGSASSARGGSPVTPQGGHGRPPRGVKCDNPRLIIRTEIKEPPPPNRPAPTTPGSPGDGGGGDTGGTGGSGGGGGGGGGGDDPEAWGGGGLFDRLDAVGLLVDRTFKPRDARRQVAMHGPDLVCDAVAHCDFLERKGEIRSSYRGAVVRWLANRYGIDERVVAERDRAERAKAVAAAQRIEREQATELERRERAERRRAAAVFASIPAGRLDGLRAAVLAAMDPAVRRLNHDKPATFPTIRSAIVQRWLAETEPALFEGVV